jgi:hypothetical protein
MTSLSTLIAPVPIFKIEIQPHSVDVRLDASTSSPRRRFYAGTFYIIFILLLECLMIFAPGKHGSSSMAQDLSHTPTNSAFFLFIVILLLTLNAFLIFITRRALWGFYPSDETFHCDSSTLTISKVRWFDTSNTQWETTSFPSSEISQVRFAIVAPDRYRSIHGLRFLANGKRMKALPGLNAQQANKILEGLQHLGVDLKETYRFKKKAAHAPRRSRGDNS